MIVEKRIILTECGKTIPIRNDPSFHKCIRQRRENDMNDNLEEILNEIKELENRIAEEIQKKKEKLKYKIVKRRIVFEKDAVRLHKKLKISLPRYIFTGRILSYLIAPFIYSMIVPAFILDAFITVYQFICLPAYGVPHLKRSDYIFLDRYYLKYLNLLERMNCAYCGYFIGLIDYVREVSSITEQYWCPIKHAQKLKATHPRYPNFLDYGNGEDYKEGLKKLRDKLKEEDRN